MTGAKSQVIVATKKGCPACEKTKPALKKAKSTLEKKKVRFAEVDADTNETLLNKLDVQALPEIVYRNKDGEMHKMPWNGTPRATNIVRWVDQVVAGKSVKTQSKPRDTGCPECGVNGGVNPKVWGPPLWFVIHMVALMYPQKPTATERSEAINFFKGLQPVLPCDWCKKHFAEELKTMDKSVFDTRDALFEWTVKFHDKVSDRTHSKQPRHTVNYWRKFYKKAAERAISKNQKKT